MKQERSSKNSFERIPYFISFSIVVRAKSPNDWWEQSKLALKDILEYIDKDKVKSIGFSGQMHGLVILDSEDNVIRPAILWNDQRTESECRFLNNDIGKDKLLSWTANMAARSSLLLQKVLWVKQNEPENFKKIATTII